MKNTINNSILNFLVGCMTLLLFASSISAQLVRRSGGSNLAAQQQQQQQRKKRQTRKMREVTIYVYQRPAIESDEFYGKLVPVQRRIVDYKPLDQALKLLLKGANEEEEKRNLHSFIFELKFVSARVKNGTAQIKFKFINPEIALESWEGGGFDYKNFNFAVEQTARQFPGVKRVSFCIAGMQGYTDDPDNGNQPVKCPF